MSEALDVVYVVWQADETSMTLHPECAPLVDRAMKQWAERRIDTWLDVHGPTGIEFSILASTLTSATRSTAAARAQASVLDKAIDDERGANRRNAGYLESEP